MSENKTRPTVQSVDDFLDGIANEQRRLDCRRLRRLMEAASGEPAVLWGSSIVGFGALHYRYASGREGDTAAVGFAPRASSITLYLSGGFDDIAPILDRLGPHRLGKGCLYLKRLADVDAAVLVEVITASLERAAELDATR